MAIWDGARVPMEGAELEAWRAASREDPETLRRLLEAGAKTSGRDVDGETALHAAARAGCERCLSDLLEFGADPEAGNREGWTALHLAAWRGSRECVARLIRAGADVEARTRRGMTALMLAAGEGEGAEEALEELIAAGAKGEARDHEGLSAEDWARESGWAERAEWIRRRLCAREEAKELGGAAGGARGPGIRRRV